MIPFLAHQHPPVIGLDPVLKLLGILVAGLERTPRVLVAPVGLSERTLHRRLKALGLA